MRWVDYEDDIRDSQKTLASLKIKRSEMESRANQLRANGLDTNILDARAREKLFVSRPNELVIFLDHTP